MWAGSEEEESQRRGKMDGMGELEIRNLGVLFPGRDGEEAKEGGTHPSAATEIWAPR